MCGIAGYLSIKSTSNEANSRASLQHMANAISHRGPDGEGYWVNSAAGIGLAHRRLAILDLSQAGAQPMSSRTGRYVIAYNGEIYNHLNLREMLEGEGLVHAPWLGHSDTETLLAGFEAWGIEVTVQRAVGMFSIAVWDQVARCLILVRDRIGEKPLYYGWQGLGDKASFLFGSELSALRRHPAFVPEINRNALANYMRHNCVGGFQSIYSGIYKLPPGHLLRVSVGSPDPVIQSWWSSAKVVERGVAEPFAGSAKESVDALETLLYDAIGQQMMSDVPLGAFLSGGVDSSTVVALMQAQSSKSVNTFSIGFYEENFNEAEHAKAVAKHLGTNHTELYVTANQALSVIPKLPKLYSEPFADSSQIPTYLVSQLAKESVTVCLSGDAGDELFSGYTRYQMTDALWSKLSRLPQALRQLMMGVATAVPPASWDKLGSLLSISRLGDKLHKGASLLGSRNVDALYQGMVSHWTDPASVVLGATEPIAIFKVDAPEFKNLSDVERMMALDLLTYLPDDILVKVDRAAMSVGLETRVPFLDHRVVEFAWSLPLDYKMRFGVSKWALREVLYRHVPRELIERPKMGFGVPIGDWLRGPLREWAESLLEPKRLITEGFFNHELVWRKWTEHLSGRRNWQYHLWDVLMFQAWLEHQRSL